MRLFALLLVVAFIIRSQAQELLPNGDFEQFDTCPEFMGQIDRAAGWVQPTTGSTDYFNACQGMAASMGVPNNLFGSQPAHGGQGYAGFIGFFGPENTGINDTHEYLSSPLAAPLVPGETYTVSFFVNLADISKYAVNDIGALLTIQPPHRDDALALSATPQITNTALTMLNDTVGWTRIQGCFTADSAYTTITIGNFHAGSSTIHEVVSPSGTAWFSYYHVDDVSVRHVPRPDLGLGPDLTICEAAIIGIQDPQPGADYLWSTGELGPEITVDAAGTYSVRLVNDECSLADTIVVRDGPPVTFAMPTDTTVDFCLVPRLLLEALPRPADAEVVWYTGAATPELLVDAAGTYTVQASAADHCAASASITIIDACTTPVYAPNAFTPNGDGINDQWRPLWNSDPGATIQWSIFDRWGHVLFAATDVDAAWDGKIGGELVPDGIYEWKGQANDPATSAPRELGGHLLLMR